MKNIIEVTLSMTCLFAETIIFKFRHSSVFGEYRHIENDTIKIPKNIVSSLTMGFFLLALVGIILDNKKRD